jgi:hypothetical protein
MRHTVYLLLLSVVPLSGSTTIAGTITSGTADVVSAGINSPMQLVNFSVSGQDFSLTGSGSQMSAAFTCLSAVTPPFPAVYCPPGSAIDFGLVFSGHGPITGNFTFQGSSDNYSPPYPTGFILSVEAQVNLQVPTTLESSVTLNGPFHGVIDFIDPNFQSETHFLLSGGTATTPEGTATVNLVLEGSNDVGFYYFLQSVHLDYTTPGPPSVPEPCTSAMTGTAFACWSISCLARRRKQRLRR